MISSVAGWCAGALVVFIGWRATRTVFTGYVFQRHNYRDHQLPTAAGVLICLGAAAVVAANEVVGSTWASVAGPSGWFSVVTYGPAVVALVVGFGFLGLIDDLGGTGESGGFRGHFRALAHGRLTTGAIKAFGGPVIALSIIPLNLSTDGVGRLRDAAIICLSANLVNLLDRAPGRAIKIGLIWYTAEVLIFRSDVLAAVGLVSGGSAALLGPDLREELMIGDTGANAIGAALGFGIVVLAAPLGLWISLATLVAINLASEFVSFSRVIERVGVLTWFDLWGATRRQM